MSAQTGVETPGGPASSRLGDRVRFNWLRFRDDPNPLWMREMRQSVRVMRTPLVMMALAILMVLVMASIGGMMTGNTSPAAAGQALFHTYFSLAYFVVTLVGPALAANSIASEREGKTWEAVLLTGLRPELIARGKFMSAFTAIALYIIMLAPAGAIPFLFGGVAPLEVLIAFVFLFLIAALSCAFGLAISAKMSSLRGALLLTLLLAVPLSFSAYGMFGPGMSFMAHELWDNVPRGVPVWLPAAYSRAPFGLEYVVYLIVVPVAALLLPAWLLYEITRANLTSITDDRGYGLKRWFVVSALVLGAAIGIPVFAFSGSEILVGLIFGMCFYCSYITFCAFLFTGEPVGPSRRVKAMLANRSALRRALRPGVVPTATLQLLFHVVVLVGWTAIGFVVLDPSLPAVSADDRGRLAVFAFYAIAFSMFVVTLAAQLRAKAKGSVAPRVLLLVFLFGLMAGPWILAAMTGIMSSGDQDALAMAALSPGYVFVALGSFGEPNGGIRVAAGMIASFVYTGLAAVLFMSARSRCAHVINEHEELLAAADKRLAEEDAQLHSPADAAAPDEHGPADAAAPDEHGPADAAAP